MQSCLLDVCKRLLGEHSPAACRQMMKGILGGLLRTSSLSWTCDCWRTQVKDKNVASQPSTRRKKGLIKFRSIQVAVASKAPKSAALSLITSRLRKRRQKHSDMRYGGLSRSLYSISLTQTSLKGRKSLQHISPWSSKFVGTSQLRGLKTKATVQYDDTLSGLSNDGPLEVADGGKSQYPPVVQQAADNMLKHKDCVLLTKVGSFYELYFHQAKKYAPLLNIKEAKRPNSAVPMVNL